MQTQIRLDGEGITRPQFQDFPALTRRKPSTRPEGVNYDTGAITEVVGPSLGAPTFVRFDGTIRAIPSSGSPGDFGAFMPTGVPIKLTLRLDTSAGVDPNPFGGFDHGSGRADANFGDTFGLPTSGPVFNLPPGFTANSQQAGIVNNRVVGAQQAVIPEPSSMALLGIGAVSLCGYGWRRRKKAGPNA